ncbi:hypothetical protein KC921_05145 [Candidatus Woesebacteria bacterium]|nr:hypothetical protein [Candidatus Woesebacteria bacterium]
MNSKLPNHCLSIVGPTATGKTRRALELAEDLLKVRRAAGVDLISVDSRQVYQGFEVLTGADVPDGWQQQNDSGLPRQFFKHPEKQIALHGVSICELTEDWSLAHFVTFARSVMQWSWANQRQPIIVGGTGLYHKYLFSDDQTPMIPQDEAVRSSAELMSAVKLQEWLGQLDPVKLEQMNQSDRANSRRLIRAIEIAMWKARQTAESVAVVGSDEDDIKWSQVENEVELLTVPLAKIQSSILQRVVERFDGGALQEVERLLALKLPSSTPVLTTLGVPEITQYLEGKISATECQQLWALHEFQYAKRQLTWWNKN